MNIAERYSIGQGVKGRFMERMDEETYEFPYRHLDGLRSSDHAFDKSVLAVHDLSAA